VQERVKAVGSRRPPETAEEFLITAERINSELSLLVPAKRPRGFVMKFRTPEEYQKWKAEQTNPWLR
jgi:hypothetical protein